ncbi:MAG: magnesium transporter [candidate division KSB1 bacterium]|nr:magnesium transporter [candidate division KSB1 bacterium]MDZ7368389.1 magnesium transporter [candidate division KSB1 bacterium]MDZ7406035.1 magnesium transporter [candidate division KSB1 bacterium]
MEELDRQEILDDVSYLIEAKQAPKLRATMLDAYPADIADLLKHMDDEHRRYLFDALDLRTAADAILEVDESTRRELIEAWNEKRLAGLVREMNSDDATDFISELPPEQAAKVLKLIAPEESAEVRQLLAHEEDTAGGIMALELVAMPQDGTVEEAIDEIRKKADEIETINHVYVIDENRRLVGIVPLKKLLLAEAYTPLSAIMNRDVISVPVGTDQEEVAKLARKYDLLSVPVVDAHGRLAGRITYDDIVDVIQEEAEEDLSRVAGVTEDEEPRESSIFRISRIRLPWLIIGLFGEIIAATVLSNYSSALEKIIALVFFIPVITAMGGNAGIQASAIVVRGLATGEINLNDTLRRLGKEIRVAILNGLLCGLVIFLVVSFGWKNPGMGLLIGTSLMVVIMSASVIGGTVPLALKRFNVDPAIAIGPFITISNDILGLLIYMWIAMAFLQYL